MMSATPDERILKCFGNVNKIELPDSQLFPVNLIREQVDCRSDVNVEVMDQTFNIIQKMASKTFENGHILIFTSGNSRMNEIQHRIIKDCSKKCSVNKCKVVVISNFDSLLRNASIQQFYENLDKLIDDETKKNKPNNVLFVLPIKYLGYASNEQKEIGKNPIKGHPNVIKIIMATNAIESSITIDSLAAVVDTGLFNHATFNKTNGLTSLMEEPISIQSQTQRKGRVGRVRPGICVQIEIKGENHPDKLSPSIQTSDITLNILSLRKININLEKITNLPDKIDDNEMEQFMSELILIHAIDKKTRESTAYGNYLTDFTMVSPFIASAILSVAGYSPTNYLEISKSNLDELSTKEHKLLLAILISYIFASPDLCTNIYSKKLQKYYDPRSDIITMLRAFLKLAPLSHKEIQTTANEYGLNATNVIRIKGQMQQISDNVLKLKRKFNDDTSKGKISYINSLLVKIKNFVRNLRKQDKLYAFILCLILKIGENKPEWLKSRKVRFLRIEDANYEPSFVYKSDQPLSRNESESLVLLKARPGSIGFDCPGYGFILNITQEKVLKMNFGTIIHTNLEEENSRFIPHPISIEISDILENNFSEPMINSYLIDYSNNFQPIYLFRPKNNQNEKSITLLKTKDYFKNEMHYYYSFIPANKEGLQCFKEAILSIEKLMPYTPSTILIKSSDSQKVISLHGYGKNNINCFYNSFSNNDYFAYKITTRTIKYLCKNLDKLNSSQGTFSIALTGEFLSFSLDDSSMFNESNSGSGQVPIPYIYQDSKFVFYDKSKFPSQMVFVSKSKIEELESYSLPWIQESKQPIRNTKLNISNNYSNLAFQRIKNKNEDFFLKTANEIAPKIIEFSSTSSLLVFNLVSSKLIIKGDIQIKDDDILPPSVTGNISHLFYNCAIKYIDGCTLTKSINLEGFYYPGQVNKYLNQYWDLRNTKKFNMGNGCLCLLCFNKDFNDPIKDHVISNLASNGIDVSFEDVQEYCVYIRHLPEMGISQEKFTKYVTMVVKQFGHIVDKQYNYERCNFKEQKCYGKIKIFIYSQFFIIPFAKMITDILTGKIIDFNIPNNIVDNILLKDQLIKNDLSKWFQANNILMYEDSGVWYGTENDIKNALLLFKENPPKLSYIGYSLSNKCNIHSVFNQFNRFYRKRGYSRYLNKATMTLYLHKDVNIDLIAKEEDITNEKEKNERKFFVNVFEQNGITYQMKYDINQVYKHFISILKSMYDPKNDYYNLNEIRYNVVDILSNNCDHSKTFPIIPFGQQMWLFVNESQISNQTKTFITACSMYCLRKYNQSNQSINTMLIFYHLGNLNNSIKSNSNNCFIKNTFNDLNKNHYIINQKELEKQKKLEKQRELEKQKILEKQRELEKQKILEKQRELEKQKELIRQKKLDTESIAIPKFLLKNENDKITINRYLRSVLYQTSTNSMIKKYEISKSNYNGCLKNLLDKIVIKQKATVVILAYSIVKDKTESKVEYYTDKTLVKNLPSILNVQILPALGRDYVIVALCGKFINEKFTIAILYTDNGIEEIQNNVMKYLKLNSSEFSKPLIYQFKNNNISKVEKNDIKIKNIYYASWNNDQFIKIENLIKSHIINDYI